MLAYDKTFDPEVVLGHCDLISRFSDFALHLDTQLEYFHTFFQIMSEYDQTFDPNIRYEQTSLTLCLRMTRPLTLK